MFFYGGKAWKTRISSKMRKHVKKVHYRSPMNVLSGKNPDRWIWYASKQACKRKSVHSRSPEIVVTITHQ